METPEQIEAKLLEALVPRGFSETGAASMDQMIDELAGESTAAPVWNRWAWISGFVAAAVALAIGLSFLGHSNASDLRLANQMPVVSLLSESEGIVSAEADEELMTDSEGNLLRGWHVQVVNEERFHDAESGYDVRVVHPRDELVLLPVSSF